MTKNSFVEEVTFNFLMKVLINQWIRSGGVLIDRYNKTGEC